MRTADASSNGAFAESSSGSGAIKILKKDGYRVGAVANPLRSAKNGAVGKPSNAFVVVGIRTH